MFFPEQSLKRGGRFYLCWVADSWPMRFAAITRRQLYSQDIRELCEGLQEVMTNESGRPCNRFSLRLSSQLIRGLVRLFERKVTIFMCDVCMLNANVFKSSNKKLGVHEEDSDDEEHPARPVAARRPRVRAPALPQHPEHEPRVEELLQTSGNVVENIQDITLKEATIPDFHLPPNDGFGEEHPEQAFQLFADRTIEQMLVQPDSSAAHSGLDLPLDVTADWSHDRSRLAPHDAHQMERISEHDLSMLQKSTGNADELDKEIPEIPEIPPLDLPAPHPEKERTKSPEVIPEQPPQPSTSKPQEPVESDLEELEELQVHERKRRAKTRLIIDKRIKINSELYRVRIENPAVELRCESSSEERVDTRVPWELLSLRPAHAGGRLTVTMAPLILRMFQRNLGVVSRRPLEDRQMELAMVEPPPRRRTRSTLDRIVEVEEPPAQVEEAPVQVEAAAVDITAGLMDLDGSRVPQEAIVEAPHLSVAELVDFQDLSTQKLEPLPLQPVSVQHLDSRPQREGRASEHEPPAKRSRLSGRLSSRESHRQQLQEKAHDLDQPDKENIPPGAQEPPPRNSALTVSMMLREAGIADAEPEPPGPPSLPPGPPVLPGPEEPRPRHHSEGSETPLGSLDRTKVSLGESEQSTESQRFMRNQWGIEGTMLKIISAVKAAHAPVTVGSLVEGGPVLPGHSRVTAARCFTSLLKLKQFQFINIIKDPNTSELREVTLGPKFHEVVM